jgi:hypothetical protein
MDRINITKTSEGQIAIAYGQILEHSTKVAPTAFRMEYDEPTISVKIWADGHLLLKRSIGSIWIRREDLGETDFIQLTPENYEAQTVDINAIGTGGGGGVRVHNELEFRDAQDCHPTSAITDFEDDVRAIIEEELENATFSFAVPVIG